MAEDENWFDLCSLEEASRAPLRRVRAGNMEFAVSFKDSRVGVISNACNHFGGPLGEGRLDGEYIVCPWHNWKFQRCSGVGEPGFEGDCVPAYPVKVENGRVLVDLNAATKRERTPHAQHPLARRIQRAPGPLRLAGIATSVMDASNPRFSGSEHVLAQALKAANELGAETRLISLNELKFRACEGYYSKSAHACTWPCSITQMDENDQMDRIYEALVHWADAILVASPIRWGAASSLYFKMAERLNCVQNQITIANRVLIRNKVAGFIIVGGQDNIQAVAGQMLGFFAELGFIFPQFPFIAHSRGWSHEDMERNVEIVRHSKELAEGAAMLAKRCFDLAKDLIAREAPASIHRGGRKAHSLRTERPEP
ncbi:NAD(P)H-dependent oxidoreductase (plasmid) [Methylocystis sp. MJC1]|uniref:Rieske 2Fe-2S domain-containing protein n=1 Tax=Methylocystis sp. MJC1 TaxID=2654282 RepID=UPI0013EA379F|nr:Rieske 2Fe-2S domain-containing protein [Methylocystis sp. MJC1]KAF2988982.1 Naphthalene 1,2-dioxygenase/salicylate 5-hydroxylase systems, ferredoxin component [Methylocystis sp. MJC1]MBU6529257.1 NAD(P)H-dependent oxidoreductase [Methylocystis sp. MJC1]UZX13931.1 NAD(P)H-dependent oxidoreductase [Methylocystis sp. MJC1]